MSLSNPMDQYLLSHVPHIGALQKVTAQTVETRIQEAIQRMQIAVSDRYDNISVLSMYWKSDNTGGAEDSTLFIQTFSKLKLQNIHTRQRSLSDDDDLLTLASEIGAAAQVQVQSKTRKLFILHYAGHAVAGSRPDNLIVTPNAAHELGTGPEMNMTTIKDELNKRSSRYLGLDVLLVMDSCCAAMAGRGGKATGARVEFMAATARNGPSNSREDGHTFTEHWCEAFNKLLEAGKPFTCADINTAIAHASSLEQFPFTFVLQEGWDFPITFHLHPGPNKSKVPAVVTSGTVVTAFHVEEDPDSLALKRLVDYLDKAPVPITVLAVWPTSSSLLLLRVPVILQELLVLPRVALILADS